MAFVLINKIIIIVLIIALLPYLFLKKRKASPVFVLSVITLFIWLVNIIADGYFRFNFVNLSISEIGRIVDIDVWSRYAMYVVMVLLTYAIMRRALSEAGRKQLGETLEKDKMEKDEDK